MNIRELEYFVAVAELGKFRSASERCFVSQPTLSGQLKKLEDELGHPLFERSTRSVMLTKFGQEAFVLAKEILTGVEKLSNRAQEMSNPFQGKLRIGIFPTLGPWLFPRIASLVAESFPMVEVYLVEEKSAHLVEQLKEGGLDVAFLALPQHIPGSQGIPLFSERFFVAIPCGHPLADKQVVCSTDLEQEELMLLSDGHCLRDQTLDLCQRHGVGHGSRFMATGIETLRQMVRLGSGITLIPQLAVPEVSEPGIEYRPVASPDFKRDIGLYYRSTHPRHRLMEELASLIQLECGSSLALQSLAGCDAE